MPVPEIANPDKFSEIGLDRHKRRLDAYAYSIENSTRTVTVSNTIVNVLHGVGLTGLTAAIVTKAEWVLPYCLLYLFGMFYVQLSN